jgi:hypothetical protein
MGIIYTKHEPHSDMIAVYLKVRSSIVSKCLYLVASSKRFIAPE